MISGKNNETARGLAVRHLEESLGNMWLVAELLNQQDKEISPTKCNEYLSFISSTAAELSQLVADLAQLSSLETCATPLNRTRLRMSELVQQGMESLHALADSRSVEVCLVSSGSEADVQGDYWKLSQAISALLEDAIRCTSPGSRVDIEVRSIPKAVRIVIRSAEVMQAGHRMGLSSFTGGDSAKTETCLSVPLAKEIVDLHGGLITSASSGKQFVMVLPVAA